MLTQSLSRDSVSIPDYKKLILQKAYQSDIRHSGSSNRLVSILTIKSIHGIIWFILKHICNLSIRACQAIAVNKKQEFKLKYAERGLGSEKYQETIIFLTRISTPQSGA